MKRELYERQVLECHATVHGLAILERLGPVRDVPALQACELSRKGNDPVLGNGILVAHVIRSHGPGPFFGAD